MNTKKRLLNTYIFLLLTYGCEAWTIGREASRRINAFEIWCYRRMLKISWINRTTNKEVFHRIKEKPTLLKKFATKRKLSLFGHILRNPSRILFVNIMEGFMDGKKSKGRPRRIRIDDINEWNNARDYGHDRQPSDVRGCYINRIETENSKYYYKDIHFDTIQKEISLALATNKKRLFSNGSKDFQSFT